MAGSYERRGPRSSARLRDRGACQHAFAIRIGAIAPRAPREENAPGMRASLILVVCRYRGGSGAARARRRPPAHRGLLRRCRRPRVLRARALVRDRRGAAPRPRRRTLLPPHRLARGGHHRPVPVRPPRRTGGRLAAWLCNPPSQPIAPLLGLSLLLFPDGRLPSPRWRAAAAVTVIAALLLFLGSLLRPGPLLAVQPVRQPDRDRGRGGPRRELRRARVAAGHHRYRARRGCRRAGACAGPAARNGCSSSSCSASGPPSRP